MHLFGLTGGIACGKSRVATHIRARGIPVIDADELAREVVAPGSEGLSALVGAFGPGILLPEGALDRKAMGKMAFADETTRQRLNAIVHPRIAARAVERATELGAAGVPLACYEAALLVETGSAERFRPLVVVACPEAVQLARIRSRDGLTSADALSRVRAQAPLLDKVALADFVIDTSGPVERTEGRTDEVLAAIRVRLGLA